MIFLTWIKKYALLGLGSLVGVLALAVKILSAKARREKKRADKAEATVDHAIEVMEKDSELDTEFKSRRAAEAAKIESKGTSDELADPNHEWVRHNRNFD